MKSFRLEKSGNGENDRNINNSMVGVIVLIILLVTGWYFWGGGLTIQTEKLSDDIYKKVSADFVQQYEIAKRQGDKVQICVQAGLVADAYLQEKNEVSYRQWKETEATDCASAGINK